MHRFRRAALGGQGRAGWGAGQASSALLWVLSCVSRLSAKRNLLCLCGLWPALAWMAGAFASSAYGQDENDSEALRQVAQAIEQNHSSIQTWQLSAERLSESYNTAAPTSDDALLRGRTMQRMSFWGDRVRGLFRSDVQGPEVDAAATEGSREDAGSAVASPATKYEPFWKTLVKAEGEVFRYSGKHGEERYGQLVIERGTNTDRRPDYFDPTQCTGLESGGKTGETFREWLTFVADQVGKQHDFGIHIKREGDRVILHINKKEEGFTGSNTYTFDLSRGGNLVAFHSDQPQTTSEVHITYEKHGGIWVPAEHVEKLVHKASSNDPGKRWLTRTTLSGQKVNEPIDPRILTLEGLGLLPGNTVVDRRYPATPVVFEYTGEGGTPEESLSRTVALITGTAVLQPSADQGATPSAVTDQGVHPAPRTTGPPMSSQGARGSGGSARVLILIGILAFAAALAVWAGRRKSGAAKMRGGHP